VVFLHEENNQEEILMKTGDEKGNKTRQIL
jgi:hypothetical protein